MTPLGAATVIIVMCILLGACGGHANGNSAGNKTSIEKTWRGFAQTVNALARYRGPAAGRARLASRAASYLSADGCRFVIAAEREAITAPKSGPCDEAVGYETGLGGYQPSVHDVRISGHGARAITKGGVVRFQMEQGKWLISRFPTVGD